MGASMNQITEWKTEGFERVVYCENPQVGLKAMIAIHNTHRGPSCGGVRILPYTTTEEALTDVLRLARGMSYKSALAGIGFGGGKSTIILDPMKKQPEIFAAFGDFVESLKGRYIAAKDMNIESKDLLEIKKRTPHVLGIEGEVGSSGDPSPVTARGLFAAMRATTEEVFKTKSFSGLKVVFQGIGHVGYPAAEMVRENGGSIYVTDTNPETLKRAEKELGATVLELDAVYDFPCDIFSPCARGAILNSKTIPRLKCKAVVGAANNQLETTEDGLRLYERGIFYAPDYMVNAGGIINIFVEYSGKYEAEKAFALTDNIYNTFKEILRRSDADKVPPFVIADRLAEERMR
jgi:leucine dehydrogenase